MTMYNTPLAHAALHNAVVRTTQVAASIRDDYQTPHEVLEQLLSLSDSLNSLALHRHHDDAVPEKCRTCTTILRLTSMPGTIEGPRYRQTFKIQGCRKRRTKTKDVA